MITTVRFLDRSLNWTNRWTRRFLVFALAAFLMRVYWFMTMSQADFPTGEVQYAVMPALLHPYLQPWQAPYGILWYGLQWIIILLGMGPVTLAASVLHLPCPNNCYTIIIYLDGHTLSFPFEAGYTQYLMGLSWMTVMTIVDIPFYWLWRKSVLLVAYTASSLWFWATTPVNESVMWIANLGFFHPIFIPLAIIMKLPIGSEVWTGKMDVWKFAFGSGGTIGHWFPYIMLGFWTLPSIIYQVDKKVHHGSPGWVPWLSPYWKANLEYE